MGFCAVGRPATEKTEQSLVLPVRSVRGQGLFVTIPKILEPANRRLMAATKNANKKLAKKTKPAYRRILLKLSGEAFQGPEGFGIHGATIQSIARELKDVHKLGVEIAIMVGGGN